ncbi:MAG TPA: hypothetical protein VGH37_05545 [Candidatus Acidoferrum sp.]|jgi:hypothetical protein
MNLAGWLKFRRGFDEHLDQLDGDAVKLYLRLLCRADWRKGKNHGLAIGNLSEMVKGFEWSADKLTRKLSQLNRKYIAVEHRGNRFTPSAIRILKYDANAVRKNAESTPEHSANIRSEVRMDAESTPQECGGHSDDGLQNKEVEAPEEDLRSRRSKSVRSAKEKKVFDPTDRLITLPKGWAKIGLRTISARFAPFLEIARVNKPRPDESKAQWCGRILDACTSSDVEYPPEFYAITKRYRKTDEPFYDYKERLAETRRLRGLPY